jgi:hypothetical protein
MNRIIFFALAFGLLTAQANAAGGFSCEADDKNVTKLVIEGATPRSEPGLINFGGLVEADGKKAEFKLSDVKHFSGRNGVIRVRATVRTGEENVSVSLHVRRNPKDEDDWAGTYEVSFAPVAAKDKKATKADVKSGKVKCFVE